VLLACYLQIVSFSSLANVLLKSFPILLLQRNKTRFKGGKDSRKQNKTELLWSEYTKIKEKHGSELLLGHESEVTALFKGINDRFSMSPILKKTEKELLVHVNTLITYQVGNKFLPISKSAKQRQFFTSMKHKRRS